ncbi:MAG: response regulator, partial [Acidimicrobiales bacterium]|nr:response regulator [Acidimicrobiales bacterium]
SALMRRQTPGIREVVFVATISGMAALVLGRFLALIREREAAEVSLGWSEARLQELVRSSSDVIAILDAGGHLVYANPAAHRYLRPSSNADLLDLVHPDDRPRICDQLAGAGAWIDGEQRDAGSLSQAELLAAIRQDAALGTLRTLALTPPGRTTDSGAYGFDGWVTKPPRRASLLEALTAGPGDHSPAADPHPPGLRTEAGGGRVLIVEDNEVNQRVAGALVERLGYVVNVVGDGVGALAALDRHSYDIVLMDCQMPRMDGYEATTEIRRREGDHRTPIIAMTASAMASERDRCLAVGMDDHLPKPIRRDALEAVLSRWVEPGGGCEEPAGGPVDEAKLTELLGMAPAAEPADPPRVLQLFLDETANRLSRIRAALDSGDVVDAGRAAHSLQGASGLFGARRLGSLGADLETACAREDVLTAETLLPALHSEFEAFRAILVSRLVPERSCE